MMISRRNFLMATGAVGAAGLLAAVQPALPHTVAPAAGSAGMCPGRGEADPFRLPHLQRGNPGCLAGCAG